METSWDHDTVAAGHARDSAIGECARRELFRITSRQEVQGANRSRSHKEQTFQAGQWVHVWRRAQRTGNETMSLQRDRWVGPRVAMLQPHSAVWIAM
eukprot:9501345-Pyramimonas_sp.AAC.2